MDPTALLPTPLLDLLAIPGVRPVLVFVGFTAIALLIERAGEVLLWRSRSSPQQGPGDVLFDHLVRPVTGLIALAGVYYASLTVPLPDGVRGMLRSVLASVAVVIAASALHRGLIESMEHAAASPAGHRLLRHHTLPLFDMVVKVLVVSLTVYLLFLAWSIDVTAWLASAGILGIALGFAAQETLSNLFAGVFILADSPYRIGDYLVLADGTRGRVTEIGLRSTRIVTNDAVEVVVPNKEMAGGRVCNLSTGPTPLERSIVSVQVAYESDVDKVRRVLLSVAEALPSATTHESARPIVRFASFDDSGITVRVGCYALPELREQLVDELVTGILSAFREHQIDIPYPHVEMRLTHDDRAEMIPPGLAPGRAPTGATAPL